MRNERMRVSSRAIIGVWSMFHNSNRDVGLLAMSSQFRANNFPPSTYVECVRISPISIKILFVDICLAPSQLLERQYDANWIYHTFVFTEYLKSELFVAS